MISARTLQILAAGPVAKIARVRGLQSSVEPDKILLYQYAICPFCNRVKAFLDYVGIDYETIEVNPLTKTEIKWSTDYRKVPIAKLNNDPLFGSDEIIATILESPVSAIKLEDRWRSSLSGMTMDEFAKAKSVREWTAYAADELSPLLYPNMCRTWSDSYRAFGYVNEVDTFGPLQKLAIRSIGSFAMYMAASKVKQKRNITDERAALNEALIKLESKGLNNGSQPFLSGFNEPNLGDLAVFGTLRSIEGLPAHREADRGEWYHRMTEKIEQRSGN